MKGWHFLLPTEVTFGPGVFQQMPLPYEDKVLVVTTAGTLRRGVLLSMIEKLKGKDVEICHHVSPNPDISEIDSMAEEYQDFSSGAIVAVGGGSAIDTAKALARLLANPGITLADNLRNGVKAKNAPLPLTAVPTTSGTGSEVTPFATIWDRECGVKRSVDGIDVFPTRAIVDPSLTRTVPRDITISTGMDVISHSLESIWNIDASPLSVFFATRSLRLAMESLERAANAGGLGSRAKMSEASLLAGMAISQTRTAMAHSMSYPMTLDLGLNHGVACSLMLPGLLVHNAQQDDGRLARLSAELGYKGPQQLAEAIATLQSTLGMPMVYQAACDNPQAVFTLEDRMVSKARAEKNMRPISSEDVHSILERMDRRLRG